MELKMVVDACGRDGLDARDCDFPPLLDWDDVMRDERNDPLGFARRATLGLLTQSGGWIACGLQWRQPAGSGGIQKDGRVVPRIPEAAGMARGSGGEAAGAYFGGSCRRWVADRARPPLHCDAAPGL